jgi:Na+/melibiose symporter-like transporter
LTSELCHDPESTEIIIIDIIDHHINNNCQARFFRSFSLFLILLGVFLFYTSYVLRLHPLHFLINLLYLSKEILIITFVTKITQRHFSFVGKHQIFEPICLMLCRHGATVVCSILMLHGKNIQF